MMSLKYQHPTGKTFFSLQEQLLDAEELAAYQKIISRNEEAPLSNRPYQNKIPLSAHKITIYEGGNLLELKQTKIKSKILKSTYSSRGTITSFTYKARARIMRKMASINIELAGLPIFITLSYPEQYPASSKIYKQHLHTFIIYLSRQYPKAWGIWRLEYQDRGSPHYHFLLWGEADISKEYLIKSWHSIINSQDQNHLQYGIHISNIESIHGIFAYVSKALGKLQDKSFVPTDNPGRFWGVINKKLWKVTIFESETDRVTHFRILRVINNLRIRKAKILIQACKEQGRKPPAWTRHRSNLHRLDYGQHWFLDSGISHRILAWAEDK